MRPKAASAAATAAVVILVLALGGLMYARWRGETASAGGGRTPEAEPELAESAPSAAPAPEKTPEPTPEPTPEKTPEATPEPTPEPTPAPEPGTEPEPTRAETLLAGMSLYEKLCQMIIARPKDVTGVSPVTLAGKATQAALEKYPVGGLLYDTSNMVGPDQVRALTANTRSYMAITPILVCDEEGGSVARLMNTVGTTKIGPMLSYAEQGTETAFSNAETIARDMADFGFNADFAPVADVWSNPENTVIGDRAYSTDFEQAAGLVAAAVEGFHAGGVACTLKHFPGHGDTQTDSHFGEAFVTRTLDELRERELLPFKAGIEAGADMVMIGHLVCSEIDDMPAPFSLRIVTELLRGELGFNGVVVTDALEMQALQDYSIGDRCVRAVLAGVDLLLCPGDMDAALEALQTAVRDGLISEKRVDESVLRILSMKEARGMLD